MVHPSIWELESFYAPNDVIIAGAGLTGLWSAYYLKKLYPSLKILIIEKNILPSGASTRNAGFACFGSVTELMEDVHASGEEKMLELVKMRYDGIRKIQKTFSSDAIDFKRYGGYEIITSQQYATAKELKNDLNWLNESLAKLIPQKNIFRLADKKISRFHFHQTAHLIYNRLEGQLHPGKLVQALLHKVQSLGVRVQRGIEITAYETAGSKIVVHNNTPVPLPASQLLICTNGFASDLIPEVRIVPARGQVLLTSPVKGLAFKGTFHYDAGYYYFRNLGNRVLLGGARNKDFGAELSTELNVSETIQQELERFLREKILPGLNYTIEHRWSGIMGMGTNNFPTIKQIEPRCFCAVGMGAMGVALAPVAGKAVAKMMSRKWQG